MQSAFLIWVNGVEIILDVNYHGEEKKTKDECVDMDNPFMLKKKKKLNKYMLNAWKITKFSN